MITGELKSKVDSIWNTMWSGGISNPLSVIEQQAVGAFKAHLPASSPVNHAFSILLGERGSHPPMAADFDCPGAPDCFEVH